MDPKTVTYLDFDGIEHLSVVDTHDGTDHLGNDNHVTKMSLHGLGLLMLRGSLLGLSQFLYEVEVLPLQTPLEASPLARAYEVEKLLVGHIKEGIKIDTTEVELPEGSPPGCSFLSEIQATNNYSWNSHHLTAIFL